MKTLFFILCMLLCSTQVFAEGSIDIFCVDGGYKVFAGTTNKVNETDTSISFIDYKTKKLTVIKNASCRIIYN